MLVRISRWAKHCSVNSSPKCGRVHFGRSYSVRLVSEGIKFNDWAHIRHTHVTNGYLRVTNHIKNKNKIKKTRKYWF